MITLNNKKKIKELMKILETEKNLKTIGVIEESHGHKGTLRVKVIGKINENIIENLKEIYMVNKNGTEKMHEVFEIRKYRRGSLLLKLAGLKWRSEVNEYEGWLLCVKK